MLTDLPVDQASANQQVVEYVDQEQPRNESWCRNAHCGDESCDMIPQRAGANRGDRTQWDPDGDG